MFADLIQNYVTGINQGVVPNIENAWSYVCKNECQKALQEALELFEDEFKNSFEIRVPLYEDELRELFRESKRLSVEYFQSKAIGEIAEEYQEDLEMKFDQKYSQY